jgi:predicted lipoprotein with Yx(FWY)xxD motif
MRLEVRRKSGRKSRRKGTRRLSATACLTATLALCAGGLASCASSGPVGGTSVTTVANASSATLDARLVKGYGKILVTSSGRTLYMLSVDPTGGSNCVGSCAIVWPALTAGGKTIKAGPGVNPALVSSFKRSDGVRQVLYNKHALYTFEQDTGPGMLSGQGVTTYGGVWWVVSATGKPVTGQ